MKVCFETFGCRLNRAEALEQEARYLAAGWTRTEKHSDADLIIVRGCSVTSRAQSDCERVIRHLKDKYPNKRLIITGCLTTAHDGPDRILETQLKAKRITDIPVPTRTARAYLKVQDGCSGKCTFCIVPKFRGSSVSTDFDAVLDRAKRFIDAGYHELVVTGCNLSLYASGGRRLPELVDALAALDADCRVRLGSLEPAPVALDTVDVVAERANVCNYLHIPIQSAALRVLAAMKRPYTIADIEKLVTHARERIPLVALGYDIMTGFPDEADLDFMATKGFLGRFPFAKAHIFPFSSRPGTIAAGLPNQIPHELRKLRAHELLKIADDSRQLFAHRFIGRTVEVLVEDASKNAGWTAEYLWCTTSGKKDALGPKLGKTANEGRRRQLVKYRVKSVKDHVLVGDVI